MMTLTIIISSFIYINYFRYNIFFFSEICQYFGEIIKNEKDVSAGMAAIRTLLTILERSKCKFYSLTLKRIYYFDVCLFATIIYFAAETVQEVQYCLQNAIDAMRSLDYPVTSIASGSELFLRFITLASLDTPVRILINNSNNCCIN